MTNPLPPARKPRGQPLELDEEAAKIRPSDLQSAREAWRRQAAPVHRGLADARVEDA